MRRIRDWIVTYEIEIIVTMIICATAFIVTFAFSEYDHRIHLQHSDGDN